MVSGESQAQKSLQLAHSRVEELQAVALQSQDFQVFQLTNTVRNLKGRFRMQSPTARDSGSFISVVFCVGVGVGGGGCMRVCVCVCVCVCVLAQQYYDDIHFDLKGVFSPYVCQ